MHSHRPSSYRPTKRPTAEPTVKPTCKPTTELPTSNPTHSDLYNDLAEADKYTSAMDVVLYSIASIIFFGWIGVMSVLGYRWYMNHNDSTNTRLIPVVNKKKKIRKFEDYWDDEGDESTNRTYSAGYSSANLKSGSTHFEEYWDENVDFSSHSSDALNISKY
jgi:hypothetical protein